MIFSIYGEPYRENTEEKRNFLLRNGIALWDIATECKIEGSKDATLTDAKIADLSPILSQARLKMILLNGALAYRLFERHYANVGIPYYKMSSQRWDSLL